MPESVSRKITTTGNEQERKIQFSFKGVAVRNVKWRRSLFLFLLLLVGNDINRFSQHESLFALLFTWICLPAVVFLFLLIRRYTFTKRKDKFYKFITPQRASFSLIKIRRFIPSPFIIFWWLEWQNSPAKIPAQTKPLSLHKSLLKISSSSQKLCRVRKAGGGKNGISGIIIILVTRWDHSTVKEKKLARNVVMDY